MDSETSCNLSKPTRPFAVPAVTIKTGPGSPGGGLLIDVGRHFIPSRAQRNVEDGCGEMNVLHLHFPTTKAFASRASAFLNCTRWDPMACIHASEIRDFVAYAMIAASA